MKILFYMIIIMALKFPFNFSHPSMRLPRRLDPPLPPKMWTALLY